VNGPASPALGGPGGALWTVQAAVYFVLLFTAAVTDATRRRIYNGAVLAAVAAGLLLSGLRGWLEGAGAAGLAASLGGLGLAFVIFYAFHWLGGLGAGDVKLMAALGALTSWRFVLYATFCVALAGAVFALGWLLAHGGGAEAWRAFASSDRQARREAVAAGDSRRTLPYAVAVCAGGVWAVWVYLSRTGESPWPVF
jgi:prepilin peptidase CpaA